MEIDLIARGGKKRLDTLGVTQKHFSRVIEGCAMTPSIHQLCVKIMLQPGDAHRQCRLRDFQHFRGANQGACSRDGEQMSQMPRVNIHNLSLYHFQ